MATAANYKDHVRIVKDAATGLGLVAARRATQKDPIVVVYLGPQFVGMGPRKIEGQKSSDYVASFQSKDKDGCMISWRYVDANLDMPPESRLGSLVNEPSPNQTANAVICHIEVHDETENPQDHAIVFMSTVGNVEVGDHILCCYGNKYERDYNVGSDCKAYPEELKLSRAQTLAYIKETEHETRVFYLKNKENTVHVESAAAASSATSL